MPGAPRVQARAPTGRYPRAVHPALRRLARVLPLLLSVTACATVRVPGGATLTPTERRAFLDAREALDAGRAAEALESIGPALAVEPLHVPSHRLFQDAARAAGRLDLAGARYAASDAVADDWRRRLLRARLETDADARLAGYRDAAERAALSEPWAELALSYELLRRLEASESEVRRHTDEGRAGEAGKAGVRASAAGEELEDRTRDLTRRHADRAEVWILAAQRYLVAGDPTEARTSAERAVELDPALWRAHSVAAEAQRRVGDDPAAAESLEQAWELAPARTSLAARLGRVLLDLQRDERAAEVLELVVGRRPDDLASRVNLAVAWARLGRLEEASVLARRLADERPGDARVAEVLRRIDVLAQRSR